MSTLKNDAISALKSFIDRIEAIAQERRDLGDEQRALFAEAKAQGFDTKAIRDIIKRRDKDPAELERQETIFDTYMVAIGMAAEAPLHRQVAALAGDALSRDAVIDSLKKFVPENGEIIARVGGEPVRIWRTEDGQVFDEKYFPPAPVEKLGAGLGAKRSATMLSIVPKDKASTDAIKDAADRAEARSKESTPAEPGFLPPTSPETEEPGE